MDCGGQFQARGFLVSSGSHAVSERELDENVYSNDDYVETASLLEQVLVHMPNNAGAIVQFRMWLHFSSMIHFTGDETWKIRSIWFKVY